MSYLAVFVDWRNIHKGIGETKVSRNLNFVWLLRVEKMAQLLVEFQVSRCDVMCVTQTDFVAVVDWHRRGFVGVCQWRVWRGVHKAKA